MKTSRCTVGSSTARVSPVARRVLVKEARALRSEGENPEYDRALCELIYWTAGGESIEAVTREVLGGAGRP